LGRGAKSTRTPAAAWEVTVKKLALIAGLFALVALAVPMALAETVVGTVAVGSGPWGVAVNAATNRIYVANGGAGNVSVVDGATNAVVATINVGSGPRGVAVNPTTNRVYVANFNAGTVSVVDGGSNSVVATVAVGSQPFGVDVNPTTNRVYVANQGANNVSVIDGGSNAVTATIPVNGAGAVAVNPTTNRIYTANGGQNSVTVIDGSNNNVLVPSISVGATALSVAVNPATNRVYVGTASNSVTIVDAGANAVLGTVAVGQGPYGLAVNPGRNRLYAANQGGNTLSLVDTAQNVLAATVNVGNLPNAVAVNPNTNRVYVANTNGNSTTVVDDPPTSPTPSATATPTPTVTTTGTPGTPTSTPTPAPNVTSTPAPRDNRYFAQTGFRIDNDVIWDYFNRRGGIATFGYPVSRTFLFRGVTVQFFQRRIVEIGPNGQARQANLLDPELMPYTTINGANFPPADQGVTSKAPSPSDAPATLAFVQQVAVDTFNNRPVNFFRTFSNTVPFQVAFPNGGDPNLLLGIDLEMWGLPTSNPAFDPSNQNFVYQRWQRGIMHYDAGCNCTQAILLADYLKAIITGQNLPADLQAQGSALYKQYNSTQPNGMNRPQLLPSTNMQYAFDPQ
jgi:YVTN family beta-propeller protein